MVSGADPPDSTSPRIKLGPAFAMENPVMDSRLWSHLPEELIERVLAWLPAANLVRLRSVCRKWRNIMATRSFLEVYSEVATCEPYIVKNSRTRSLRSFDLSIHRWRDVRMSYLPLGVGFPVSSSCGLICFMNHVNGVLVSNPLTRTWKRLPQLLCRHEPILVGLTMWKRPSHYKVIVVEEGRITIFDSVFGAWRKTGCLPPFRALPYMGVKLDVAFCNGSLYTLTMWPMDCGLFAFNIQDEVWSKVRTGRLPGQREYRNLVTCKGHMVIVGRNKYNYVCVWRLEWKSTKWREVGRMPQEMLFRFITRDSERFQSCSHGDLIFIASDMRCRGVVFDLAQKMWHWVEAWSNYEGTGCFSFEPRFDSQV